MNLEKREKANVILIVIAVIVMMYNSFIPERDYYLAFGYEHIPNIEIFVNYFSYITRIAYNLVFWVNVFLLTGRVIKRNWIKKS